MEVPKKRKQNKKPQTQNGSQRVTVFSKNRERILFLIMCALEKKCFFFVVNYYEVKNERTSDSDSDIEFENTNVTHKQNKNKNIFP